MALETAIGYLVALSVPLWLVFEAIMSWQRSPDEQEQPLEAGHRSTAVVTGTTAANRGKVTTPERSRIAA
jgi:vancomycin permeability regulator SanA